ncbi:MAG: TIGR00282 family metallophosphoesterase [Ignavibacteria bacterium]
MLQKNEQTMGENIKVLFIGDIVGEPGYKILKDCLSDIISQHKIDFVIANAENISDGAGMLKRDVERLLELPINTLTGGNHTFDKIQFNTVLNESVNILRPNNYPPGVFGKGYEVFKLENKNCSLCIINLIGRLYMKPNDCPFRSFDKVYNEIAKTTKIIIVDFHAEATSEKYAFAWYVDGRATAVLGTHTHIQTADEKILPKGTAYITDVGMTGPYDSVIGLEKSTSIRKFIYGTPQQHQVAENDTHIAGVILTIDSESGKSLKIDRFFHP